MTVSTATGTLNFYNSFNGLDDIGLFYGVERLPDESNASYKLRIYDSMSHKSGSDYMGIIYAINRDLGYELFDALTITPNYSGGVYVATNPAVEVKASKLILYSDYTYDVLTEELNIDLFNRGDGYFVGDLVDYINANSTCFTATLECGSYVRSMKVYDQISCKLIASESIPSLPAYSLKNTNVVKGSIYFSDQIAYKQYTYAYDGNVPNPSTYRISANVFAGEKNQESDMAVVGDFYIDYQNGKIYSYSTPAAASSIRYKYNDFPFTLKAAPVMIYSPYEDNFKDKLFHYTTDAYGNYVYSLPTKLGIDFLNSQLEEAAIYWGQ